MESSSIAAPTADAKLICELPDRYQYHFRGAEGQALQRARCGLVCFDRRPRPLSEHARAWGDPQGDRACAPADPDKAAALENWLRQVEAGFDGRVLGIDNAVSDQWGRMSAIRPIPVIDGLLAATAVTNGLTLVTRNDRDIAGLGARLLNPFRIGETRRRS